jgi:glycosyltransferase involved in cell wall biosynthesis
MLSKRRLKDLPRRSRLRASMLVSAHRAPLVPDDMPLVTVVIPTYNWSGVLRYAIRTALWQTYSNIEVLAVGDACTDDSEQVVGSFADPRVRWHNLPENTGSQAGPNAAALELARGDHIAYLGHDDVWLPNHLAWLMHGVAETGSRLAHTVTEWIGPGGRYRGYGVAPISSYLAESELARAVGWRDYREIVLGPDYDFIERAHEIAGTVSIPALTVFKFPSSWRKNSYVEKPSHEQAAYVRRIESERGFVYRELIAEIVSKLRAVEYPQIAIEHSPDPFLPGWRVKQLRRARGLE